MSLVNEKAKIKLHHNEKEEKLLEVSLKFVFVSFCNITSQKCKHHWKNNREDDIKIRMVDSKCHKRIRELFKNSWNVIKDQKHNQRA